LNVRATASSRSYAKLCAGAATSPEGVLARRSLQEIKGARGRNAALPESQFQIETLPAAMNKSQFMLLAYICVMHKAKINGKEFAVEVGLKKQTVNGKPIEADIVEIRHGHFHIIRNYRSFSAQFFETNAEEKTVTLKVNQTVYTVSVRDQYDELLHSMGLDTNNTQKGGDLKAPMPGLVLNVMVAPGQKIQKGDAVLVLEAMKMENILKATADGEVKKIQVKKGDKVEKNQVMVVLV